MNINTAEIQALAQAAKDNPYDPVALNDYGMAMPPAVTLELLARLAAAESASRPVDLANFDWDAEMTSIRQDAERYRFVMQSIEGDGEHCAPGIYFIEEDGRGCGAMLFGQEATDAIDAARGALAGPVYRCHKCNSTTPPPEPYRAYVTCACGEKTAATAAQAGHPDAGVFAWLYVKESNGAVQLSRTKQHAPGNWVENDGYSINPLYEGPEVPGVTPDAWAFRTLRDEPGRDWKLSVIYPLTACEPGHLEVKALYKKKPITAEPPRPSVTIGRAPI